MTESRGSAPRPHPCFNPTLLPPAYTSTKSEYDRAVDRISTYITSTTTSPHARARAKAIYSIHPPGHPIHGTAILLHGLASTPELLRPTMSYLHANNFNVYAPPGAGHAFDSSQLPYTLLRNHLGYAEAREILLADPQLCEYFALITTLAAKSPPDYEQHNQIVARIRVLLKQHLTAEQFKSVMGALEMLSTLDFTEGDEHVLAEHFESDHHRYDSHPYERLADVSALPGPVYVLGFSMGGLQALNLVARSKAVSRLVLIAPFFGAPEHVDNPCPDVTLAALGCLDLYELPFPISTVSGRHWTACTLAAKVVGREEIVREVREVQTFCVLSEGDDSADRRLAWDFMNEKVPNKSNRVFMYPEGTGLKHSIQPHTENPFSQPLLQEVLRFFLTGKVHLENMLRAKGDPAMPDVDPGSLELTL